jgi:hypothetical protein
MKMVKAMCVLACCAGVSLMAVGCKSDEKKSGSMGATSDKASCCQDKSSGSCSDKSADKATTTKSGSMGAVGAKSGCCSGDAGKTN